MAQPSVEYPPWLTPIPSVITDAAGAPVATSTSISYVTPVYYGPSIPLGSLYSYGGYSIPPSIQFSSSPAATSTTETPITTSATPTTSITTFATPTSVLTTALPTSVLTTATPTSVSSTLTSSNSSSSSTLTSSNSSTSSSTTTSASTSTSLSSSLSSSTTSPASSSSVAPVPPTSGIPAITGLTKPQLVGVIVASILGLVFLFVLALFLFLWWKARKNRREYRTLSPIDDDYIVVPSGVGRSPGEGSPRQSGEETDSFLQRRGQTGGVAADTPTRAYTARIPPPTTNSNSSDSTNSHASGFGVLLERPTIQFLPSMPEYEQSSGQHLSEAEMERLGRENVIPDDNAQYQDPEYSGAYAYTTDLPPPRLVDSATAPLLGVVQPHHPNDSVGSKGSLAGENPEEATVHMARRVKVESLGPRSNSQDESSTGPSRRSSAGALLSALGLGALANLGRKSWFKNFDSPLPTHHEPESPSYLAEPLSEKDLETGQHTIASDQRAADSFGNRPRGAGVVGTGPDGSRPISTASGLSAASGGTQFFDARSRPGTPGTPILTPLPRAMTPVEQPVPAIPTPQMTEHLWFSSPLAGPPAYEEPTRPYSTHSPTRSQTSLTMPPNDLDILDMPAPTALNNFASISSLKDTATGSSFGMKVPPFPPPGLGDFGPLETTIRPVGWASSDTGTDVSDSRGGSLGYVTGRVAVDDLSFDVLEEEPPEAEHGWRSIATGGFGDSGRGTFGTLVQGPDFTSEQGSLHSMRSHFNPSNRSSGSAPASSRIGASGSVNSNSSRSPSNRSGASSNIHALMHKGSISSDSRRRHAPVSPALSAFGVHPRGRSSPSPAPSPGPSSLQHQYPFDRPHTPTLIDSPPPVYMSPEKPGTIKSLGSSTTMVQGDTSMGTVKGVMIPAVPELEVPERSASASPPLSAFGGAPWAGGLDRDWQPMP